MPGSSLHMTVVAGGTFKNTAHTSIKGMCVVVLL